MMIIMSRNNSIPKEIVKLYISIHFLTKSMSKPNLLTT